MIGNLIQQQFYGADNWPFGAALTVVLMAFLMIFVVFFLRGGRVRGAAGGAGMSGGFDRPRFLWSLTGLVYAFLFAPIVVVILFSFNGIKSLQVLDGLSFRWYEAFWNDDELRESLMASIQIAAITTVVATVHRDGLALGVDALARADGQLARDPPADPARHAGDRRGRLGLRALRPARRSHLSMTTIILAHITFSISYVVVVVRGRLATMGTDREEAALDLGATPWQAVRLVTLPALWPAILAAAMIVFALSFDDFVLSFFTTGETPQPLPVRIYSALRFGISPTINAVGTRDDAGVGGSSSCLAVALPRLLGRQESGMAVLTGRSE